MNMSGSLAAFSLAVSEGSAISQGLIFLRTRVHTSVHRRLVRFGGHAFVRRRVGAFANYRAPHLVLLVSAGCTTARDDCFV